MRQNMRVIAGDTRTRGNKPNRRGDAVWEELQTPVLSQFRIKHLYSPIFTVKTRLTLPVPTEPLDGPYPPHKLSRLK